MEVRIVLKHTIQIRPQYVLAKVAKDVDVLKGLLIFA